MSWRRSRNDGRLSCSNFSTKLQRVIIAIGETGVVGGEFGYPDALEARKALLQPWRDDSDEKVRQFAQREIHALIRTIAALMRAAEAGIAHRRLQYHEEFGGDRDEPR
jgi:hypothetical protein